MSDVYFFSSSAVPASRWLDRNWSGVRNYDSLQKKKKKILISIMHPKKSEAYSMNCGNFDQLVIFTYKRKKPVSIHFENKKKGMWSSENVLLSGMLKVY